MQFRDHDPVEFIQRRPVGNRWAVIVGISKYKHRIGDLNYAHRDAEEFCALLQKPSGGGFDRTRILSLIDHAATTSALTKALRSFLKKPEVDDLVVLYFACHGFSDPDRHNAVYFVTHDADPEDIPGTAVPMRDVELALKDTLRADRVIIIADTCHSAAIALTPGLRSVVPDARVINKYLEEISTAKPGVALLTSATATESAKEGHEWGGGHGVFTHFVLEGLRGAADGYKGRRDGKVTVGELFDYVRDNVQRETQDTQHPTIGSRPFDRGLTMAFTGGLHASEHHEAGTGMLRLAYVERDRAGFAAAARHFSEAIEMARAMGGEYPEAELGLARALLGIGAYDQARAHLEKLVADDRLRTEPTWDLGMAHARAGRRPEAIAAFSRFAARADGDPRRELARAYVDSRPPRRLAVLVGVDRYAHSADEFGACRNDAERMSRLLASAGFETIILCGEAATKDAVLDPKLYAELQEDDQLILFYSGNSRVSRTVRDTEDSDPYLSFHDFTFGGNDGPPRGALSANEIFSALSAIRARTLAIIDSECSPTLADRVRQQPTFDIMFAAGPRQNAYVIRVDGEPVGRFTHALCESVADVQLATLTHGEWFGRARRFMRNQTSEPRQRPLLLGDHAARMISDDELLDWLSHTDHGIPAGIPDGVLRRRYSHLCGSLASSNAGAHMRFAHDFLERKQLDDAKKAFTAAIERGDDEGQLGLGIVQALQDHASAADTLRRSIATVPAADAPLVAALAGAAEEMDRSGARRALLVAGFELPGTPARSSPQVELMREVLNQHLRVGLDDITVLTGAAATRAAVIGAVQDLRTRSSDVPVLFYYCGDLATPDDALVVHGPDPATPGFLPLDDLARTCRGAARWITVLDGEYTVIPGRREEPSYQSRSSPARSRDIGDPTPYAPAVLPVIGRTTLLSSTRRIAESLRQATSVASWERWFDCIGPVKLVGDPPSGPVLRDLSRFLTVLHQYRTAWLGELRHLLERLIEDREKTGAWPEGRADLAQVLVAMADYPGAVREYRRVIGLLEGASPPGAAGEPIQRARRELGRALLESGTNYTAAVSELNQVAAADPFDARAHYYLSRAIRLMVERETLEKASQALETYRDLGGPLGDLADLAPD
jgi:tetratricopeptide (TPR) repeat protein